MQYFAASRASMMFPAFIRIQVPADRKSFKVSELAREISCADPNAVVISNRVDDGIERVITFQKGKAQQLPANQKYFRNSDKSGTGAICEIERCGTMAVYPGYHPVVL